MIKLGTAFDWAMTTFASKFFNLPVVLTLSIFQTGPFSHFDQYASDFVTITLFLFCRAQDIVGQRITNENFAKIFNCSNDLKATKLIDSCFNYIEGVYVSNAHFLYWMSIWCHFFPFILQDSIDRSQLDALNAERMLLIVRKCREKFPFHECVKLNRPDLLQVIIDSWAANFSGPVRYSFVCPLK